MYVNGPEIVEKKYTVAQSIPDVTPRKNKNFDPSGLLYAGSSGILIKVKYEIFLKVSGDNIVIIYDSFVPGDGDEIFLCKTERMDFRWFCRDDLPSTLLQTFIDTHRLTSETLTSCNTDKTNIYTCEMKCKTRGIQIACNNCGIVVAHRELFGSESLTQVALMYLDMADNYIGKLNYNRNVRSKSKDIKKVLKYSKGLYQYQ